MSSHTSLRLIGRRREVSVEIRTASRAFLLFVLLLNVFILLFCIIAVSFIRFSELADAVLAGVFVMVAIFVVRNTLIFGHAYARHPYFRIQVRPGWLKVRTRRRELHLSSSNVDGYFVYNNKIVLRLQEPIRDREILPYVKVRERSVTIYFYFLKDTAEFLRSLREFDDAFSDKSKVNAGMVAQMLGQGLG